MISHPFEVKASASDDHPDVLMITWRGAPAQSVAEIYLPAVAAADIIALADTVYGRHRLTSTDAHTVQFPASDLMLIPIPGGEGAYAGLLSVDARPSVPEGHDFSVSVRQLNTIRASIPRQPNARDLAAGHEVADEDRGRVADASATWRRVKGAFQFTFSGKSEPVLAAEQVRLLSWLKWRVGVTPATHRWNLVLQRYLKQTESLVWDLGIDPNSVGPSKIGTIGGHGGHGASHGDVCDGEVGKHPPFPSLGEELVTGKVSAIHYDRFGDFRGFTILTERGDEREYLSTEHFVEELVRTSWVERSVLQVVSDEHHPERPGELTLLRYQ